MFLLFRMIGRKLGISIITVICEVIVGAIIYGIFFLCSCTDTELPDRAAL